MPLWKTARLSTLIRCTRTSTASWCGKGNKSPADKIGTIGNAHGLYAAHLHFEVHKNLAIGVVHTMFSGDLSNYYVPSEFIKSHRTLQAGNRLTAVAMNNYVMPSFAGIPALPFVTRAIDSKVSAAWQR